MGHDSSIPRVLLLQIRHDPRVRREEHESFADYSGLPQDRIDVHNVFDRPDFGVDVVEGYDALFVGGASEASVLEPERYPFVGPSFALMRHCAERGLPVFASCFGFQLAVIAFGGVVFRDERDFEMGTLPIGLTGAARSDPIFRDTPDDFMAVSVHRERATHVPEGCVTLAETSACIHSFRVARKPFWAFQFHPEVDRARLVQRLTVYKAQYTDGDAHLEQVLAAARETPESNALVGKFVERVLGFRPGDHTTGRG